MPQSRIASKEVSNQSVINRSHTESTSSDENSGDDEQEQRHHSHQMLSKEDNITPRPQKLNTQLAKKKRKQRNPVQLERRFWRDVEKLQNRTDFLIPRLPFSRLLREIMLDCSQEVTMITPTALEAIQTASEMYLTQRLQDAYMLTLHRGRITLDVRDMELINYLKMYL